MADPSTETQTDLRGILTAKYDEIEAAPEPTPEAAPEVEAAPAEPPAPVETEAQAAERARDDAGRFAKEGKKGKTTKTPATVSPDAAKPGTPPEAIADQGAAATPPTDAAAPVSPEPPKFKAPQSFKPHAREKWAAVPVEVQEEIDRVDREVRKTMQESSEARKFATNVHQTLAPFEGLARANGLDTVRYAGTVMQTAAALHMGTPQQKAAVVAQLIGTYGIDVDAVNAVMQGQAPAAAPQAPPQVNVRQEMQRVFSELQNQQLQQQATSAIEKARADSEFWGDVGEEKIVNLAAALINSEPGLDPILALKNSYGMLAERTPTVSGVLKQRAEAEAAKARLASTQQARAAAGSIKGTPTSQGESRPAGLRAVLEARAAKLGIR
jgi:hypothetical protein